jgi:flagellar basal-body rod modification protein FlgD
MSNVTNTTSPANDVLSQYSLQPKTTSNPQSLGKNEFMNLMVAQMKNQSPLNPQDNTQFISQLAQFSSLEAMQKLNTDADSMKTMFQSTQALQASAMVGRSVLVPSSKINLGADAKVSGMVDLPASTGNLHLSILNGAGELVNSINLGQQAAGKIPFSWDGTNSSGQLMPPGDYTIKAQAGFGSSSQDVSTLMSANVDSVSVSKTGALTLNVAGQGAMPLDQVREIK